MYDWITLHGWQSIWKFLLHILKLIQIRNLPQPSPLLAFKTIHGKFWKCLLVVSFPGFWKACLASACQKEELHFRHWVITSWKIFCSVPKWSRMYPHTTQEETDFLSISASQDCSDHVYFALRWSMKACIYVYWAKNSILNCTRHSSSPLSSAAILHSQGMAWAAKMSIYFQLCFGG